MKQLTRLVFLALVATFFYSRSGFADDDFAEDNQSEGWCDVRFDKAGYYVGTCATADASNGCWLINYIAETRSWCGNYRYAHQEHPTGCDYIAGRTISSPIVCYNLPNPE